jgi:putative ABC transport system permease protein
VDGIYSFTVNPGPAGYADARRQAYLEQVAAQVQTTPGVAAVSVSSALPIASEYASSFVRSDRSEREDVGASVIDIGPAYFARLGIPMAAGREFTREDAASGANLAVINESLARQLFAGGGALEGHLGLDREPDMRVIGIVKDVKPGSRAPVRPAVFRPLAQARHNGTLAFVIRASGGSTLGGDAIRAAVRNVDASIAVGDFSSTRSRLSRLLYRDRILAFLSSGFAALALMLCAIGVFGLTTFRAQRRTQEIGVRLALGATRRSIEWLLIKDVGGLAAAGCVAGIAGFAAVNRVLSTVLFELTPGDPASVAAAAALLVATIFLAGLVPALRAAKLDLSSALRRE